MSTIQVRKALSDDLPIIQEIARRTISGSYRSFLGDESVDGYIDSAESDRDLAKGLDNCDVLLLDDVIIAFTIYFDDLIDLMMVDIALHRTGIGTRLLAHTETQLFARDNAVIRLETFAGNQQAINFYVRNGWSVTGEQEDKEYGFARVFFEKQV